MYRRKKLIVQLKRLLDRKIQSFNLHQLHADIYQNHGLKKLNQCQNSKINAEISHITKLLRRILELESIYTPQKAAGTKNLNKPNDTFRYDLRSDEQCLAKYKRVLGFCMRIKDGETARLLHEIIEEEEEHIDWVKDQLMQINTLSLSHYLHMHKKISADEEEPLPNALHWRRVNPYPERGQTPTFPLMEALQFD